MIEPSDLSSGGQVGRFRQMAVDTLTDYSLKVAEYRVPNYGNGGTFCAVWAAQMMSDTYSVSRNQLPDITTQVPMGNEKSSIISIERRERQICVA